MIPIGLTDILKGRGAQEVNYPAHGWVQVKVYKHKSVHSRDFRVAIERHTNMRAELVSAFTDDDFLVMLFDLM